MTVTRRTFSTVALGASVLPLWRRADAATPYDIVVAGGGTAGIPLAIFAAARGARVLVIEKGDAVGGNLPYSGGMMSAAGTVFQKAKGIADTPDLHYADTMRMSRNTANGPVTRRFVDNAADTINWLAGHGYTINDGVPRAETGHHPFSAARYHASAGGGKGVFTVMEPLFKAAVAGGKVDLKLSTGVVDLIQDKDGRVRGVVAEDAAGATAEYTGRSTVLATGGCAANPRMFADLHGVPLYANMARPLSQGMGITLGLAAGGMLWGKGLFIAQFGSVMADDAVPSKSDGAVATNPKTRPPWEIYVNTAGERFVREDEPNNGIREEALTAQVGHRYWIVFDQNAFDKAPPLMPRWEAPRFAAAFNSHPMFAKGRTLNELAVRAGVDPQGLARSVEGYNAALAGQKGDPMGRAHRPAPIARGPFYAIRLQGTTPTSTVGIAINDEFKVVTAAGAPIPGLYAIGEVIGNGATAGNALVGGSLITPALTFGRLLGEKMLPVGA